MESSRTGIWCRLIEKYPSLYQRSNDRFVILIYISPFDFAWKLGKTLFIYSRVDFDYFAIYSTILPINLALGRSSLTSVVILQGETRP